MSNLINGKEYYFSNQSGRHARASKSVFRFVGVKSNGLFVVEDTLKNLWQRQYAVEIPEDKYVEWDDNTRPLYGLFQHVESKDIYCPRIFTDTGINFGIYFANYENLLEQYKWMPDPKKPNDLHPCGVKQ